MGYRAAYIMVHYHGKWIVLSYLNSGAIAGSAALDKEVPMQAKHWTDVAMERLAAGNAKINEDDHTPRP